MKIFIINLERSVDRRIHIVKELNSHDDFLFEIFPAIDGNINKLYREKFYVNWLRMLCYARPLVDSQIGCFASHYELWNKCIHLNENIIVLEDDIELTDNFNSSIRFLEEKIGSYKYIRMWGIYPQSNIQVEKGIKLYKKGPRGTQGYAISPDAAKLLIKYANKWIEPVDDYMDKYWIHGVLPYCLTQEPITCLNEFSSSIVNLHKPIVIFKITRECYKLYHLMRKNIFNFKSRLLKKY